jgi:hypothetical protein
LIASPPRDVSLYLVFMSAPVSRMVLITRSKETLCEPSPETATPLRALRAARVLQTAPERHRADIERALARLAETDLE